MTRLETHRTAFGNAKYSVLPLLLAGGWTHEAVFRCPAAVLSDWFRERNEEEIADALADPISVLLVGLRDATYEDATGRQLVAIRKYVREILKRLKK